MARTAAPAKRVPDGCRPQNMHAGLPRARLEHTRGSDGPERAADGEVQLRGKVPGQSSGRVPPQGHTAVNRDKCCPISPREAMDKLQGGSDSTKLGWDPTIGVSRSSERCRCLLVTLGAKWCPACEKEQPQLVTDVNADPSFCVLGVLRAWRRRARRRRVTSTPGARRFDQNPNVVLGSPATD